MAKGKYQATAISLYLQNQGATQHSAHIAGRAISEAWNNHNFYAIHIREALEQCVTDSPRLHCTANQLIKRMQLFFDVWVHDVPVWEKHINTANHHAV